MSSSEESTKPGVVLKQRSREASEPVVTVTKIQMPLPLVISLLAMGMGVSSAWWKVMSHTEARNLHLSEELVTMGGGIAYKNEVRDLSWDVEKRFSDADRRLRRLLQSTTVSCRYTKTGSLDSVCTLSVPEE